jgi:hypothetical protein
LKHLGKERQSKGAGSPGINLSPQAAAGLQFLDSSSFFDLVNVRIQLKKSFFSIACRQNFTSLFFKFPFIEKSQMFFILNDQNRLFHDCR